MADLYPDTPCPACGRPHTLYCQDPSRHRRGAVYEYTCPATAVHVPFCPAAIPEAVILAPGPALPLTWVSG